MSAIVNPVPAPDQSPAPVAPPEVTPARKPPSRLRFWLFAFLGLAGGAVLAWQLWLARKPAAKTAPVVAYRTAKVASGVLQRTVRVAGTTAARNFANIIIPILRGPDSRNSLVLLKLAKAGTLVKKGDLLIEVDTQSAQDHIDDVMDMVRQAENDILKRKAEQAVEWDNLQQTVRVAKADFDKAGLDYKASEVRTVIDQELLKLAVEEAQARYKQLQADLGNKKIAHAAELKILDITAERQRAHLNRHTTDIKKLVITAPIPGLVVMQTVFRGSEMQQIQEGDQVFPGQPVMKIVNTASMMVEGSVSQMDSEEIRVGQPATVTLDAFPGLQFPGRVATIGALATGGFRLNYYIRSIPVKVYIEGSDPRLIPDLSAAADVVLESAQQATLAPRDAVAQVGGKALAYVRQGEGFVPRELELGLRNHTHVAVLAGLKPGEEVRLN